MRKRRNATQVSDHEQIDLLRGGSIVSSFVGSFGTSLRETRLTASLGYVMALAPEPFCRAFGFSGKPRSVALETRHAQDRSDILVETSEGVGIVEAKVGAHDPFDQALKYPADWRVLLTEHRPTQRERNRPGCRYLRWRDLVSILEELEKSSRGELRFLSEDLHRYLKEHNMVPKAESVEVYAREINEEKTLALFLHGRMYGCYYEASSRLPEALYFAPHFGQTIAKQHPGIRVGISYLAKIDAVEVVESFNELKDVVSQVRGKQWQTRQNHLLKALKEWDWPKRHSFLFLGEPRLVFNPPVKKEKLQAGRGWLSKRFFSFDTLFEAWGC